MFKRLDPRDINITPFKVYKQFTVTNLDSGSGVYGFRAISGSGYNFTKEDPVGGVLVVIRKSTIDAEKALKNEQKAHKKKFKKDQKKAQKN